MEKMAMLRRKIIALMTIMVLAAGFSAPVAQAAEEAALEEVHAAMVQQVQVFAETVRPAGESGENMIHSPFSYYFALKALSPGLTGDEKALLDEVILPEGISQETYFAYLEDWLNDAMAGNDPSFLTQTYMLGGEDKEWNEEYIDAVRNLAVKAESVNFQDEATFEALNESIASFTDGLIDPYFSPERIEEMTANEYLHLIVLNLLYFSGNWSEEFSEAATEERLFYGVDGETAVDMMHQESRFFYTEADDYQAIRLLYRNDAEFLVVLPKTEVSTDEMWAFYGEVLAFDDWSMSQIDLALPKWDMGAALDLTDSLYLLGLESFQDDLGETTFFTTDDSIAISQILQRIEFVLDEQGTKAAAVTEIDIETTSLPIEEEPIEMTVDRPFVFAITYDSVPLFEGAVMQLGE